MENFISINKKKQSEQNGQIISSATQKDLNFNDDTVEFTRTEKNKLQEIIDFIDNIGGIENIITN